MYVKPFSSDTGTLGLRTDGRTDGQICYINIVWTRRFADSLRSWNNEPFIAGIDFLAPLGKSDHSVLNIHCTAQVRETTNVVKYNYTKGDYDSLRISCQINWEDILSPFSDVIETRGSTFRKNFKTEYSLSQNKKKLMLSKKINGLALSAHLYGRL